MKKACVQQPQKEPVLPLILIFASLEVLSPFSFWASQLKWVYLSTPAIDTLGKTMQQFNVATPVLKVMIAQNIFANQLQLSWKKKKGPSSKIYFHQILHFVQTKWDKTTVSASAEKREWNGYENKSRDDSLLYYTPQAGSHSSILCTNLKVNFSSVMYCHNPFTGHTIPIFQQHRSAQLDQDWGGC